MKHTRYLLIILATLLFSDCTKDTPGSTPPERPCNLSAGETISATVNNNVWTGCEFKAVYYTFLNLVSITAIDKDSKHELRFFITLDTLTPLNTYSVGSNTTSGIEIVESPADSTVGGPDIYFCDFIKPGIGGTINLSKLDTLTKKITANFNVKGYSMNQQKFITIQNGVINNVKLDTSHAKYSDNSYISADINNLNWYGRKMFKKITSRIISPQYYEFLEIKMPGYYIAASYIQDVWTRSYSNSAERYLSFQIPLSLGTGTFQLLPRNHPM